jgi:hypothetical protein
VVTGNSQPIAIAVSNLNLFAAQLPQIAEQLSSLVASNETEIHTTVKNLEAGSATLTNLLADLNDGRGVAGRLLRDEALSANLEAIARNLSITTSYLNKRGLCGILWKQKTTKSK